MSYKSSLLALLLASCVLPAQCQAARAQSDSIQQHLNSATQYMHQNRPDLAIPELETAVKMDPANLDAQANLGVLYYFKREYAQAVPHLHDALLAKPDLWKVEALLGLAELRLKDVTSARLDLANALPHLKGEKIQREAGEALLQIDSESGDLDKAASAVAILLDSNPTDAGLLATSFRLYSELANNAMVTLALAAPQSAELHQSMAQELARHGQDNAAIANYREAIRLNPKLPGVHLELGDLLFESPDEKLQAQAAAEFDAALAINPQDEKALLMQGREAARHADMQAAYAAESRAIELQPDDTDACTELAKTLMSMKQPDKARALLVHAIGIDPTNETAHYRLSTLDRQQGKTEEAKQELALYQKFKDMKARLRSIFSDMRMKMGDKPEDEGGMSN